MNQHDGWSNRGGLFLALALLSVFLINLLVRAEVIRHETLIADDLIYLPRAVVDQCIIPFRHPIDFNFICYVVGAHSVFVGRVLFIALLTAAAALGFATMRTFRVSAPMAALGTIAAFGGIPMLSQTTFLTGSYPTHGLFFAFLALWFTALFWKQRPAGVLSWAGPVLAMCAMAAAGVAATSMTLVSLALSPLALCAFSERRNAAAGLWLLAALLPALSFVALQFTGVFSNHYGGMSGWVRFDLASIMTQARGHLLYAMENLGDYIWPLAVLVFVAGLLTYLLRQLMRLLPNARPTEAPMEGRTLLIGIAAAGFIVCTAPTLLVAGSLPRYLAAPLTFLFLGVFTSLDLWRSQLSPKLLRLLPQLAALFLTCGSVYQLHHMHQLAYHKVAQDQYQLTSTLKEISETLAPEAQLLVLLDEDHSNATQGFNHWSTHLARYAVDRTDITAVIGKRSRMTHDPITGTYTDHGQKYWAERGGRTFRKSMVGLDRTRPTYAYALNQSTLEPIPCISIVDGTGERTFSATSTGLQPVPAPEGKKSCATFLVATAIQPLPTPEGPFQQLSGKNKIVLDAASFGPALAAGSLAYELGFSMKSNLSVPRTYRYTKTSPPMPFFAPPLIVYQTKDDQYKVVLKCKDEVVYTFNEVSPWTRVEVGVSPDRQAQLRINGTVVAIAKGCKAPESVTLGHGYLERHWAGEIADLSYFSPPLKSAGQAL